MVKRLPTMWETWVQSQEEPLEKDMATHCSTLAWKIPWTEDPGRLQFMGSQRAGHNWATSFSEDLPDPGIKPRSPALQAYALTSEPPGKPRNTWSNRQIWPWSTKWSKSKANRVLPRGCTGHSKYPLPTTQETTLHLDITRWSILKSDWLYSLQPKMEKLYIVSKNNTRSWLWLRSWTPYCQIQT